MKTNELMTNVSAVPRSDHQRMYSSEPFGKKISPSAKRVGTKIHKDIQTRSDSIIMGAISFHAKTKSMFKSGLPHSARGHSISRPSPTPRRRANPKSPSRRGQETAHNC